MGQQKISKRAEQTTSQGIRGSWSSLKKSLRAPVSTWTSSTVSRTARLPWSICNRSLWTTLRFPDWRYTPSVVRYSGLRRRGCGKSVLIKNYFFHRQKSFISFLDFSPVFDDGDAALNKERDFWMVLSETSYIKVLLKLNAKTYVHEKLSKGTRFSTNHDDKQQYFYLARSIRVDPKTGSFFMIPRFIRSSTFGRRRKNFRSFSRIFNFSFTIGAVTTAGESRPAFKGQVIKLNNWLILFTWKVLNLPSNESEGISPIFTRK